MPKRRKKKGWGTYLLRYFSPYQKERLRRTASRMEMSESDLIEKAAEEVASEVADEFLRVLIKNAHKGKDLWIDLFDLCQTWASQWQRRLRERIAEEQKGRKVSKKQREADPPFMTVIDNKDGASAEAPALMNDLFGGVTERKRKESNTGLTACLCGSIPTKSGVRSC